MAIYTMPITAIREGQVTVNAQNEAEALEKAWQAIRTGDFFWFKDFGAQFSVGEPRTLKDEQ